MFRFNCFYKKVLLLAGVILFCFQFGFSQFKVRFRFIDLPANHLQDSVYIAGNFNGWNPAKNGKVISKTGEEDFIELADLPEGEYQYKFTRGSWLKTECNASGNAIGNRFFKLSADTVILVSIAAWQDDFETVEKMHTSSPNVHIIDTAFFMPQLGRTRRIWLYLPPGYKKSKKHFPVIYMQDGQNLFDAYTSGFGEWGIDEIVDSMVKAGRPPCIIVGIDNGPKRLNEYNPYDFKDFGKGEGDKYLDFIVENLKPFIDKHYRTLRTTDNTIIAGSSMGGLIAYYAMLKYPDVFGKGGIFSPAFWVAEKIKEETVSSGKKLKGTLFFYMGEQEGEQAFGEMKEVTDLLGKNSDALIYVVTDPDGKHNEQAWHKWFPEFYKWVFANGFNNVVDLDPD